MTDLAIHPLQSFRIWKTVLSAQTCCELAARLAAIASTSDRHPTSPETLACLASRSETGLRLWIAARQHELNP